MKSMGFHSNYIPEHYRKFLWLLLLLAGTGSILAQGTESHSPDSHLAFFEERAHNDAAYELSMSWQNEEDEIDFWTDQRNYEQRLKEDYNQGYQVYIMSKRAAYMAHREFCDQECNHGDHFREQAAFYYEFGGPAPSTDAFLATSGAH
jgi:hypothetical protein